MKRTITILYFLTLYVMLFAQAETAENILPDEDRRYKNFGGFVLDMGSMLDTPSFLLMPPTLTFTPTLPSTLTVNPEAVQLTGNTTYTTISRPSPYTLHSLLYPGAGTATLQSMTYRFVNGIRLTTYGEYDADGYRKMNPAALPWEKNNFQGGLELRSANGKFGVRMEVKTGRNYLY